MITPTDPATVNLLTGNSLPNHKFSEISPVTFSDLDVTMFNNAIMFLCGYNTQQTRQQFMAIYCQIKREFWWVSNFTIKSKDEHSFW